MANRIINTKALYFNKYIQNSLGMIPNYPGTLIQAPMGYGKTTAVRNFLSTIDADVIWQSVYDQGDTEFWAGFCQAISRIDAGCGNQLKKIGMPKESLMKREAMSLLEQLHLQKRSFLVIDDYHFVKTPEVDDFLEVFVRNVPAELHLIILSRTSVFKNTSELQLKGIINYIGIQALQFSPSDIKEYYAICGIKINEKELSEIYSRTEGWVSALYLLAREYELHGAFVLTKSISELIYHAVYEPLDEDVKAFLMSVCHFDQFSLQQAEYMWNQNAGQLLKLLMEHNAFIILDPDSGGYCFHSIFSSCLQERFRLLDEKKMEDIWRKMGELYLKNKEYLLSMKSFCKAKDYNGFLTALEQDKGDSIFFEQKEFIAEHYDKCPVEVKREHPVAILVFMIIMLVNFSELALFEAACREFLWCLENNPALDPEEKNQLMGEYELVLGIASFNDMFMMGEHFAKAESLLRFPPKSLTSNNSWTFGSPSVLCLYHREAGALKHTIQYYQNTPNYSASTGGHGRGASNLMEAEWQYHLGAFENAEILTFKAINEARSSDQNLDIVLCANFLLMRLALLKGNFSQAQSLLLQMREEIKEKQVYTLIYTIELCDAYLHACLGQADNISDWLMEEEYLKNMFPPSIAFANIVLGKTLLAQRKATKLLGLSGEFLQQASVFPNLLASIYIEIYVAAANCQLSRTDAGVKALKRSIDMAAPDCLILPFVENADGLEPLLHLVIREEKYSGFIKEVMSVGSLYRAAVSKINLEHFTRKPPRLTAREKEVALLVMEGLNNKEIGSSLYISPNTVKRELKSIFSKLGINSRVLLKKEMFL